MQTGELLDKVIAAHGGRERWRAVEIIEAAVSSGGLAFTSHLQPFALRNLRLSLSPHAQRAVLHGYCRHGWQGVWTPTLVHILDTNGRVVADRRDPRLSFSRLDRKVRWDKLDLLYFAGYALWNYLSFPFILENPGVDIVAAHEATNGGLQRLTVRFDESVPTHSRAQEFHLDAAGLLRRHDYTADVIGRWATAANLCLASTVVGDLRFYTRRQVYPRLGGAAVLPFPRLVWIAIDDIRVVPGDDPGSARSSAAVQGS